MARTQQQRAQDDRQRRKIMFNRWLCAASAAVLTYLMISSSDAFRAFSPIPTHYAVLYAASFLLCALQGWSAVSPTEGLLKIPFIVLLPPVIYGAGRALLPAFLLNGGPTLIVMMTSWVLQRVILHALALAFLGCAGMVLGMLCAAYFVTWS